MASPLFDTHAHLDVEEFASDRSEVMARARRAGVLSIVCPGITAASSRRAVELAAAEEGLHAAVGLQPNSCGEAVDGDWDAIVAMASAAEVVALGETGLDRHWDFTPLAVQQDYFDRHLRLSHATGLPVIIHCREADADVLAMLEEAAARGPLRGLLHAFSGDASMAAQCVELGLYVSFAGPITYTNKKFASLAEAAKLVPADRLLIETDSPYLVPHPLRGKEKRNEPAFLCHTAARLAQLRGISPDELAALTTGNARRLFGLS